MDAQRLITSQGQGKVAWRGARVRERARALGTANSFSSWVCWLAVVAAAHGLRKARAHSVDATARAAEHTFRHCYVHLLCHTDPTQGVSLHCFGWSSGCVDLVAACRC